MLACAELQQLDLLPACVVQLQAWALNISNYPTPIPFLLESTIHPTQPHYSFLVISGPALK